MNTTTLFHKFAAVILLLLALMAVPTAPAAVSVAVGLSPYSPPDDAKIIRRQVSKFVLEAPQGTVVTLYDAYALNEIARFDIPLLHFDSPEERAHRLAVPFAHLAKWYEQSARLPAVSSANDTGALRVPEFLETVARGFSGQPGAVLLVGSPLDLALDEPDFSMVGGKIPSDAHLLTNLVGSIYGTADKVGRLRGLLIHYCYLHESAWQNQLFKESVHRFWSLFFAQQSGQLVNFTADLNRVFADAIRDAMPAVGTYKLDPQDRALEMRQVQARKIPVATPRFKAPPKPFVPPSAPSPVQVIPPPQPPEKPEPKIVQASIPQPVAAPVLPDVQPLPIVENPPAPLPPPAIPVAPQGRIGIAAWWLDDADIDLYVGIPGQHELSYKHTSHKLGKHYRDIRHASKVGAGSQWRDQWEYVELSDEVAINQIAVWLNLYRGCGHPVAGKVRFQFGDGRIFESSFTINSSHGNFGKDAASRQGSPCWVPIKLQKVINN